MSEKLGTLEDLPEDYRKDMTKAGVAPLWPMMRNVLPHGSPNPVTKPGYWNYDSLRPLLLRAGELTPVEKAERRVLVLSDPGRGTGAMQATSSIYLGMQLLLPGESAPAHRHTPAAARIIVRDPRRRRRDRADAEPSSRRGARGHRWRPLSAEPADRGGRDRNARFRA